MEKESDYLVREPKRILGHLYELIRNDCIITTQIGTNQESFLTAILELDPQQNTLKLDSAPSELLNKQLLTASKVLFRTELDGIKVSFAGQDIRLSQSYGHPAFAMPFPEAIFWLQRRQFYRVRIPSYHEDSICRIAFKLNKAVNGKVRTGNFRLADLSVSGFAFLNQDPEFKHYFECDKLFDTSGTLHLHENHHGKVGFVIKNITEIKIGGVIQQRMGCQLTEISPAFESHIQLYMQQLERLKKNISSS